jgi:flagellar brake protein
VSRSAAEIARILERIKSEGVLVTAYFPSIIFQSRLVLVEPKARRIVLEQDSSKQANAALLSRPRCSFHCQTGGWHVEFVATEPRAVMVRRRKLIQCRFPGLLARNARQRHERAQLAPPLPLRVQADAAGIMPFDGFIVDVGFGGVGFLVYASSITLEPGTVLRGCRIQVPGGAHCVTDLEVRYSQAVTLADGRRAMRSGCRFLTPSPQLTALAKALARALRARKPRITA